VKDGPRLGNLGAEGGYLAWRRVSALQEKQPGRRLFNTGEYERARSPLYATILLIPFGADLLEQRGMIGSVDPAVKGFERLGFTRLHVAWRISSARLQLEKPGN
jgi:hypothetical protein